MLSIRSLPKVKGEYRFGADLSKTNWFGVGGPAEVLYRPLDEEDLANFMKQKDPSLAVNILGVGSNLLVRDGGIDGVVIKLGRNFTQIQLIDHNSIVAGAASLNYNVAQYAHHNNLTGLEFLVGIPGTIGGGVAMNAGAYGSDFAQRLLWAEVMDNYGILHKLDKLDIGFIYRGNNLPEDWIITKACFKLESADPEQITYKMDEITTNRTTTQPIKAKTSGSSFTNPHGYRAWQLIDQAGCRGLKIGDAQISELHCNFIINCGNATALDIEMLGEEVRKRVFDQSGIMLHWEIKIIGKKLTNS